MFWFKICQSLIVVILIILMIKMIKDVVAGENLATMIVVMILILIKVIIDLGSKPGNDDVNLGPTGAKDAPSLLHSDPAEAGSEF